MARITYVKHARQRYATVPVLDEQGNPKYTTVMVKRWNNETEAYEQVPKKTKHGREVTMKVTVQDRTRPLPNPKCDFPGCEIDGGEILPGTSYMHITPRSGPYGGTQRNRHSAHPAWKVWEYSYSVSAQAAQVQDGMHNSIDGFDFTSVEDFDSCKDELVSMAEDFVSEREEALSNMPEQLQDGSQASEYVEMAESWRDEIDNVTAPDFSGEVECDTCTGSGTVEETCETCEGNGVVNDLDGNEENCDTCQGTGVEESDCDECGGEGKVESDTPDEEWIEAAAEVLHEAVDSLEI